MSDAYLLTPAGVKKRKQLYMCSVPKCIGKNSPDLRLFQFPDNPKELQRWCDNIGLKVEQLKSYSRVCSRHFVADSMGKKKLKFGAVPYSNSVLSTLAAVKEKKHHYKCSVPNCISENSANLRLFRFPDNPIELQLWCDNIDLELDNITNTSRVCSRHFDESSIGKKKLKFGAVPYLNLAKKCAIQNCTSTRPPNQLYIFPQHQAKRKQWIDICGLQNKNHVKNLFLCAKHFEPKMFIGTRLKKYAFPRAVSPTIVRCKEEEKDLVQLQYLEVKLEPVAASPHQCSISRTPVDFDEEEEKFIPLQNTAVKLEPIAFTRSNSVSPILMHCKEEQEEFTQL